MEKQINRFPVYVISRGRWDTRYTTKALEWMGCDYKIIVEEQEYDKYREHIPDSKILILPKKYIREYDTCDKLPNQLEDPTYLAGAGVPRNYAWDHSIQEGHDWHWVCDDNIDYFYRINKNRMFRVKSPLFFRWMEDFVLRYKNIGVAGPNYGKFVMIKKQQAPLRWNTRVYSCLLIRNDLPFRWRSRYNDDTDFSIRVLKEGLCTVLFNAFAAEKKTTQTVKGGLFDMYKQRGRMIASRQLAGLHPDICRVTWKFSRWHHHCDYSVFKQKPILKPRSEWPTTVKSTKLIPTPADPRKLVR